jgi:ribosomal protein S20
MNKKKLYHNFEFFYLLINLLLLLLLYYKINKKKISFLKIMNKKQRNRKLITQNRRNKIINKRYSSTIKTFFKIFLGKIKENKKTDLSEISPLVKLQIQNLVNNLYKIMK